MWAKPLPLNMDWMPHHILLYKSILKLYLQLPDCTYLASFIVFVHQNWLPSPLGKKEELYAHIAIRFVRVTFFVRCIVSGSEICQF